MKEWTNLEIVELDIAKTQNIDMPASGEELNPDDFGYSMFSGKAS